MAPEVAFDPEHPQRLNKRIRLHKCNARLRLPTPSGRAELVVTCQLEKHSETPDTPHLHRGKVHMNNETCRDFTLTWFDEGVAQIYTQARVDRRKKPQKVTA